MELACQRWVFLRETCWPLERLSVKEPRSLTRWTTSPQGHPKKILRRMRLPWLLMSPYVNQDNSSVNAPPESGMDEQKGATKLVEDKVRLVGVHASPGGDIVRSSCPPGRVWNGPDRYMAQPGDKNGMNPPPKAARKKRTAKQGANSVAETYSTPPRQLKKQRKAKKGAEAGDKNNKPHPWQGRPNATKIKTHCPQPLGRRRPPRRKDASGSGHPLSQ